MLPAQSKLYTRAKIFHDVKSKVMLAVYSNKWFYKYDEKYDNNK